MMKVSLKIFFVWYLVFTAVGFALVAAIGVYQDPAHLFSTDYERQIAAIVNSGSNAYVDDNYDERFLQKCYVAGFKEAPEIVIIGSSRSMQVRADVFAPRTMFNNAVSRAGAEDYIAIFGLYERHGIMPATVVLGLDPWVLNANYRNVEWLTLLEEYRMMAPKLGLETGADADEAAGRRMSHLRELISLPYFQESLLGLLFGETSEAAATEDTEGRNTIILRDGSRVHDALWRSRSVDKVEAIAFAAATEGIGSLANFHSLDEAAMRKVESFVGYLRETGVEVVFFLPPYHPAAYEVLAPSAEYGIITEVEYYYRELAERYGIPVFGSYNPVRAGCGREDFFDAVHPKDTAVAKIFASYGPAETAGR